MEDERWTTKDKIDQLRGITSLYDSTNANIREKLAALRKKQSKDIKNLTTQNKKYRQQYEEVLNGDKTNLLPVLHSHPKLQLAFKNLNPNQIEEELKQSIFCKNKELDRLRYKKKNLEGVFLEKKLEIAELQKDYEDMPENYLWEQEIANQIQSISVKLNAARTNRGVYEKALNILEKDAIRFDEVLEGLNKDLVYQCESIVKSVEMGQNVAAELNQLQQEYKSTERDVRANMKERDRAIRGLRADIDNVRIHGHVLRESRGGIPLPNIGDANLEDDDNETSAQNLLHMHINREIKVLESMLGQITDAAKVYRVQDICPRMEGQRKQQARLKTQVEWNETHLQQMLELHNQLDVLLEVMMYHTMTNEAVEAKEEREQLRKDIATENDNLNEAQTELLDIGEKIVSVRTALLTLNITLDNVYPSAGEESIIEMHSSMVSNISEHAPGGGGGGFLKPLYQPNTEALTLMELVTKKTKWLIDQVGSMVLEGKRRVTPEFIKESKMSKVGIDDEADNIVSDLLDELDDMDDPSVLTRKGIKAESQKIVDLYDNPQRLFQDSKEPKFKKHKCF